MIDLTEQEKILISRCINATFANGHVKGSVAEVAAMCQVAMGIMVKLNERQETVTKENKNPQKVKNLAS